MSQGDYIKRKQISHKLVGDGSSNGTLKGNGLLNYNTVLNAKDYTDFKKYSLEGTITSTTATLNNLEIPNKQRIFGMEMDVSECPSFVVCGTQYTDSEANAIGTQSRSNRVLSGQDATCNPVMKAPGRSVPPIWDYTNKKIVSKLVYPAFKDKTCNCKRSRSSMIDGKMWETFPSCPICN